MIGLVATSFKLSKIVRADIPFPKSVMHVNISVLGNELLNIINNRCVVMSSIDEFRYQLDCGL